MFENNMIFLRIMNGQRLYIDEKLIKGREWFNKDKRMMGICLWVVRKRSLRLKGDILYERICLMFGRYSVKKEYWV